MKHHKEIVDYFNRRGVSAIFLLRRNLLRRMISIIANAHDRDAKLLNGTHKSHVHSLVEVSLSSSFFLTINFPLILSFLISCYLTIAGTNTCKLQAKN